MRPRFAAYMFLLAAGCSDPELSRMEPGSIATNYLPDGVTTPALVLDPRPGPLGGRPDLRVPKGTRVAVVADDPTTPSTRPQLRLVRVRIEQGTHEGLEGLVSRLFLRPAR